LKWWQVNLVHAMTIQAGGSGVIDMPVVSWLPQYHDMGLIGTFLAVRPHTHWTWRRMT
jgi:acyl-CoA synthetase (AMP-forming)/AMP-acid ligase II